MKIGIVYDMNNKIFIIVDEERWKHIQEIFGMFHRTNSYIVLVIEKLDGTTLFSVDRANINLGVEYSILGFWQTFCIAENELLNYKGKGIRFEQQ